MSLCLCYCNLLQTGCTVVFTIGQGYCPIRVTQIECRETRVHRREEEEEEKGLITEIFSGFISRSIQSVFFCFFVSLDLLVFTGGLWQPCSNSPLRMLFRLCRSVAMATSSDSLAPTSKFQPIFHENWINVMSTNQCSFSFPGSFDPVMNFTLFSERSITLTCVPYWVPI